MHANTMIIVSSVTMHRNNSFKQAIFFFLNQYKYSSINNEIRQCVLSWKSTALQNQPIIKPQQSQMTTYFLHWWWLWWVVTLAPPLWQNKPEHKLCMCHWDSDLLWWYCWCLIGLPGCSTELWVNLLAECKTLDIPFKDIKICISLTNETKYIS